MGPMHDALPLDPAVADIVSFVIMALFAALLVLWILLPFAVFGTKKRLDRALATLNGVYEQLERSNRYLDKLLSEVDRDRDS